MTGTGPRVPLLFLISDTGGGHRSAALAVSEALECRYPGRFEPVIADPLAGPGTPASMRWFVSLYGPLIRISPWLWHVSWRFSDRPRGLSVMYATTFAPAAASVASAIERCRPAAVVAFHGMVTRPAVLARQQVAPRLPVLTVITDLITAHRAWREPRVEAIAVPSTAVAARCEADGYPAGRCTDTGLPVSAAFTAPPASEAERLALRAALGAPGRFLVVLTGGAAGAGQLYPKAMALVRSLADVTVVTVCGRNEQLRRKLTEQAARYPGRLVPLGFVTNMADWLRCADAVVTKAGPGTIAETLCCGTPLLLTSFLSGQEQGNADYVVSAGAGRWVPRLPQLLAAVRELRDDPALARRMRAAAARAARPDAAAAIASLIASLAGTASEHADAAAAVMATPLAVPRQRGRVSERGRHRRAARESRQPA